MIVGSKFDGDDDHQVMALQHAVYGTALGLIAYQCRDFYVSAARLVLPNSELGTALSTIDAFDHRTLQTAHDHLAAHWRATIGATHPVIPGLRDGEKTQNQWLSWLRHEVRTGRDHQPEIVRAVCEVLAFPTSSRGHLAEQRLLDRLAYHYPFEIAQYRSND